MSLKITTLIENLPDEAGKLKFEHGFSVFIETADKRILFDTGQTGAFTKNAEDLGIDLQSVDMVILSHGHYDHTGGVPELLSVRKEQTLFYAGKEFFLPKYKRMEDDSWKYNGNPFGKELLPQLHYINQDVIKISDGLFLFKNFVRQNDFETVNPKFFVKTEEGYEQDLFPDEIALGIETKQGLVLIVGCSHVGIVNIVRTVKERTGLAVYSVLGGTHLVEADEERLDKTMEALRECGLTQIAVSHCTGEPGMERVAREFGSNFVKNNTGHVYVD
jgi:7,8-dihydropterin-6-yl-methyl-4-(beta-D-ribofuranosyl)aminobenzene 5'-phosphate synthase